MGGKFGYRRHHGLGQKTFLPQLLLQEMLDYFPKGAIRFIRD